MSRYTYHSFLSVRGEDTRKNFTDHLYTALVQAGIHIFVGDDGIERGENIVAELQKVIKESKVSIIVFSRDYASSRWCLDELVMIMERRRTGGHTVVPVFYGVDPSHVRKQTGSFAEAFARHEKRFKEEMDKVERWRAALREVADLPGMVLGNRHVFQFIQDIATVLVNITAKAFNWSQLPNDLTSIVVNQLTTIEDFAASSQVCHHWQSACSNMNWTQGLQLPWLMLSENPNSKKRRFFSLHNNLCYELELPTVCGRRSYGTSQGWIIAVGPDLQAHLLHPLHRVNIDLPVLYALQNQVGVLTDWFNFIQKFIVFKISDDQFLVMTIYGPSSYLAYAKSGDSEWVIDRNGCDFKDVTFFGDHYYALCGRGVLKRCYGPNDPEPNGLEAHLVDLPPRGLRDQEKTDKMYLVESNGKLYAVFRYGSDVPDKGYKTTSFLVYKFQFNLPDDFHSPRWAGVKDLEDCAIFVGDCNSWSICASNIVNCKMNCIYFTDDNWGQQKTIGGTYEGHDIGVFDMASKKIEYLHFGVDTPSDYSRPIWFRPTLQHKEGSRPIWLTTTVPQ